MFLSSVSGLCLLEAALHVLPWVGLGAYDSGVLEPRASHLNSGSFPVTVSAPWGRCQDPATHAGRGTELGPKSSDRAELVWKSVHQQLSCSLGHVMETLQLQSLITPSLGSGRSTLGVCCGHPRANAYEERAQREPRGMNGSMGGWGEALQKQPAWGLEQWGFSPCLLRSPVPGPSQALVLALTWYPVRKTSGLSEPYLPSEVPSVGTLVVCSLPPVPIPLEGQHRVFMDQRHPRYFRQKCEVRKPWAMVACLEDGSF